MCLSCLEAIADSQCGANSWWWGTWCIDKHPLHSLVSGGGAGVHGALTAFVPVRIEFCCHLRWELTGIPCARLVSEGVGGLCGASMNTSCTACAYVCAHVYWLCCVGYNWSKLSSTKVSGCCCTTVTNTAKTHNTAVMGMVSTRVPNSDTVPVPAWSVAWKPQVYPYPCGTLHPVLHNNPLPSKQQLNQNASLGILVLLAMQQPGIQELDTMSNHTSKGQNDPIIVPPPVNQPSQ